MKISNLEALSKKAVDGERVCIHFEMFSTPERLAKRKGKNAPNRFEYLQKLVTEFQDTQSENARTQILANLANFAYDPINYGFLRRLNVIDLFLDQIKGGNTEQIKFSIAGICNLCLDKENQKIIFTYEDGIPLIVRCLSSTDEETVLSAITTLNFLASPESESTILVPSVVDCMKRFARSNNNRLRNLAQVFLEEHCPDFQTSPSQ